MYSEEAIRKLQAHYGGRVGNLKTRPRVWRWTLQNQEELIRVMGSWLPELTAKREQAQIFLDFLKVYPRPRPFCKRTPAAKKMLERAVSAIHTQRKLDRL
jgi:hypothetical protein